MSKPKVIAIVGPTASGKTALSVFLAHKIGGEIISADSRQVYRGLNIGTGKITKEEMQNIPHHLLDIADPKTQYSASDFVRLAKEVITKIYLPAGKVGHNKRIPIIVGGTGLYIDSLLGRMVLAEVPPNEALRQNLEKKSLSDLLNLLKNKDQERFNTIEKGNKRRIVRALEIIDSLGKTPKGGPALHGIGDYKVLWLGINPPPDILGKNIHQRLIDRVEAGMIEEAQSLHENGLSFDRMEELGLEYKYLSLYLQKKLSKEDFLMQLEIAIRQYAKRQIRWFKRNKNIHWITNPHEALMLTENFLQF